MTNHETAACRTTQHCAFHGWCRRCDPDFAAVMSRVNVAIQRTDADESHWGPLYAAVAEALRPAAVSVPPPATRADALRWAADIAEEVAESLRKHHEFERSTGALDVMTELRRLADEPPTATKPEACPTPESHNWGCGCPGDRLPLYSDRGVDTPGCDCGHNGMGMRWHSEACLWIGGLLAEARELLSKPEPAAEAAVSGPCVAGEQQNETPEAEAHPPTHTWKVESPRRDTWASWGATYDDREWASERYESAIEHASARAFRLVRATTTYTVEAEHTPAVEAPE